MNFRSTHDTPPKIVEKFSQQFQQTKTCWNWTGDTNRSGAPIIRIWNGPKLIEYSARRVSFVLKNGTAPIKPVRPVVCQNKLCVNPDHLVSGDEARFWNKVQKLSDDQECWIWTGDIPTNGYGRFTYHDNGIKTTIGAHVYSWQLYSGRPVPKGIFVCHKCDHTWCVNPYHLFLGTIQDNTEDRDEKERQAQGEAHGCAKLTYDLVSRISSENDSGVSRKELSMKYGVGTSTIHLIVHNKIWKRTNLVAPSKLPPLETGWVIE